VGERPQPAGAQEVLQDAAAAGAVAAAAPLYTRLRLAGLRNSGRRTAEDAVARRVERYVRENYRLFLSLSLSFLVTKKQRIE
jgi:hypothetical protein